MKLTVVGSGDAFGSGGRLQTCYHVALPEDDILIDCGATAVIGMQRLGLDPDRVSTIFISHLHGDHFGGIPFLILHAHFVTDRKTPLTIAGPPGTQKRIRDAQELLFPESSKIDLAFELRFVEMTPGTTTEVCGAEVSCVEVSHPSGAPPLALRIAAGGRLFAFSGDTEWLDVLADVARDADLFMCECYAFDQPIPYHVRYRELADNLKRLSASRIMLSHLGHEPLERLDDIASDFLVAEDGMVVEV